MLYDCEGIDDVDLLVSLASLFRSLIHNVCGGNEAPRVAPMSRKTQSFSSAAGTGHRTAAGTSVSGTDYSLRAQISDVMLRAIPFS